MNTKNPTEGSHSANLKDTAARKIAGRILQAQRKTADYLAKKEKTYTVRQKRWMLMGFCLLFGGWCVLLLAVALLRPVQGTGTMVPRAGKHSPSEIRKDSIKLYQRLPPAP